MNKLDLIREVVDLAVQLDYASDDTVMCNFHGHVKSVELTIYEGEWKENKESVYSARIYCGEWNKNAIDELVEMKTMLEGRLDACHQ